MITPVIAVLNFFSPQYEFGFWSWVIGFTFFGAALLASLKSENVVLVYGAPIYGLLLFFDETQQGHECFAEFTKYPALYYISFEILLGAPFAMMWLKENPIRKKSLPLLVVGSLAFSIAIILRFLHIPGNFKILEELAEFSVAAVTFIYIWQSPRPVICKKSISILIGVLFVTLLGLAPQFRSELCPRVDYWVRILSYF